MKKTFAALLRSPGKTATREGVVTIHSNLLEFRGNDAFLLRFPLKMLKLNKDRAHGLYLTHPHLPNQQLELTQPEILQHPLLVSIPGFKEQFERVEHPQKRFPLSFMITLVLLFCALIISQGRTPLVKWSARSLSAKTKQMIGDLLLAQFLPEQNRLQDTTALNELAQFLDPLLGEGTYHLYLEKSPQWNCYILPGHHVVITQGLINNVQNPSELVGAVAHALGHESELHLIRSLLHEVKFSVLLQTFVGKTAPLIERVTNDGDRLLNRQITSGLEDEANEVAFHQLLRKNIDPQGLLSYQDRLEKKLRQLWKEAALQKEWESFVSPHLPDPQALAQLRARYQLVEDNFTPRPLDAKLFQGLQWTVKSL